MKVFDMSLFLVMSALWRSAQAVSYSVPTFVLEVEAVVYQRVHFDSSASYFSSSSYVSSFLLRSSPSVDLRLSPNLSRNVWRSACQQPKEARDLTPMQATIDSNDRPHCEQKAYRSIAKLLDDFVGSISSMRSVCAIARYQESQFLVLVM
jgi:hypothetical protein